ncbi:porphobilinogen synthase [Thermospira aquatica]|uniref:Delta-aminolevulinic acid dehydratase n=1 Tax=Thermospira aquatica TaxID=2828656 RepID=A0AAX3BAK7_9SPIR|nr:porphobilinogen synthase [Thermospira aquatica]URA09221.1 porphobilinogen synthase [Thermospira aquatica]
MFKRFRDRRKDPATRLKFQETFLSREDFILPLFIVSGRKRKEAIVSLKNISRMSIDYTIEYIKKLQEKGLRSILLFGVPDKKGIEQAYDEEGIIQTAIREIKQSLQNIEIITDVCLCSYTEDGHCHIGENDATCEILAKIALSHAKAGADVVAPSDMMDGRVYYIRKTLNEHGFVHIPILSYSAKYASNFYGPFREIAKSTPKYGDRKTYQLNYANVEEAMEEIEADIDEGATMIMIKPALSYLDIIHRAKERFTVPIYAYNVSGEYAAINFLVENHLAKEEIVYEVLLSIKRAGASKIVTYFTPWILEELDEYQSL